MKFSELFETAKANWRSLVFDDSFTSVWSYIRGYDVATWGKLLDGFQEWCSASLYGRPTPLSPEGLIRYRRTPGPDPSAIGTLDRNVSPELEAQLVADLIGLIEEFLADRPAEQFAGRWVADRDGLNPSAVDFQTLFQAMSRRKRMYVSDNRFLSVVSFVDGCDAATDGKLLAGFGSWCAQPVFDKPSNMHWSRALLARQVPGYSLVGEQILRGDVAEDVEEQLSIDFFRLIQEFLSGRPAEQWRGSWENGQ